MQAEIFTDFQTTITSGLIGSLAGVLADKGSAYVLRKLDVNQESDDIGSLAMTFAGNAMISSVVYFATANAAPATVSNAYFSYIFFLANVGLTDSSIQLAKKLLSGVLDQV